MLVVKYDKVALLVRATVLPRLGVKHPYHHQKPLF